MDDPWAREYAPTTNDYQYTASGEQPNRPAIELRKFD